MHSRSRFASRITVGLLALAASSAAHAQILDPNAFTSLGIIAFGSGNYTIDTDALTFAGKGGGVLSNGIAVFDFSSINIGTNATISVTGSHPVALLSRSDFSLGTGSSINLNGGDGTSGASNGGSGQLPPDGQRGTAGAGGYGGEAGPGSGYHNYSGYGGGGGGFGGNGGDSTTFSGRAYGDLETKLEGGSGGGHGSFLVGAHGYYATGSGGGGGGGALEIKANGSLAIAGSLNANGGLGGGGHTQAAAAEPEEVFCWRVTACKSLRPEH